MLLYHILKIKLHISLSGDWGNNFSKLILFKIICWILLTNIFKGIVNKSKKQVKVDERKMFHF